MRISVVIPAYNEEKNIGKCLESLIAQATQEPFEVIVVNNASTDATRAKAEAFKDRLHIRVIDELTPGRGGARATGFAHASGTILFSTDADAEVPPQWIESYMKHLEKHADAVAVTGPPRIADCGYIRNAIFNITTPYFLRFNQLYFGNPGLCGFSFAVRADAYRKSGGFNPNDDAYEDIELGNRLAKVGRILWVTDVRVLFSGRRFKHGMLHGWFEYIQTFVSKYLLRKKHVLLRAVEEQG